MSSRPRILITLDEGQTVRKGVPFPRVEAKAAYARAVEGAGGVPLWVAPTDDLDLVAEFLAAADGLVITGGAFDLDPRSFGVDPGALRVDTPKPRRTRFEWSLLEAALAADQPVLGICGGMQLLNVVLGGTLIIDIAEQRPGSLEHEQPSSPAQGWHPIALVEETSLAALAPGPACTVNSTHHQAVDAVGRGLRVSARSPDGVVEAIERDARVVGVQWHPELQDDALSRALYAQLVSEAARAKR